MTDRAEVVSRTAELRDDAREVLRAIEADVPSPYTAEGLYQIFATGFLPVPYLWECREEFEAATRWSTRVIRGSVKVERRWQESPGSARREDKRLSKRCLKR